MVNNLFWGNGRRLLGVGTLVVFAIRSFNPSNVIGCALGPTAQYITVLFQNSPYSSLAHEVGHACVLGHFDGGPTNLMTLAVPSPQPPGDLGLWLANEQLFLMRAAARCTYF